MAHDETCAKCGGLTRLFSWYADHPKYQVSMRYLVQRHRRECLRIPRVVKCKYAPGWWMVQFPTGYLWCGSFDRAIEVALKTPRHV